MHPTPKDIAANWGNLFSEFSSSQWKISLYLANSLLAALTICQQAAQALSH
jgi:hypothetical protein